MLLADEVGTLSLTHPVCTIRNACFPLQECGRVERKPYEHRVLQKRRGQKPHAREDPDVHGSHCLGVGHV